MENIIWQCARKHRRVQYGKQPVLLCRSPRLPKASSLDEGTTNSSADTTSKAVCRRILKFSECSSIPRLFGGLQKREMEPPSRRTAHGLAPGQRSSGGCWVILCCLACCLVGHFTKQAVSRAGSREASGGVLPKANSQLCAWQPGGRKHHKGNFPMSGRRPCTMHAAAHTAAHNELCMCSIRCRPSRAEGPAPHLKSS